MKPVQADALRDYLGKWYSSNQYATHLPARGPHPTRNPPADAIPVEQVIGALFEHDPEFVNISKKLGPPLDMPYGETVHEVVESAVPATDADRKEITRVLEAAVTFASTPLFARIAHPFRQRHLSHVA